MSKLVEEDLEQHIIDQECYICFEPCDQKAPCACNKKCHPACHRKFNADRQQCEVCLAYYKNPKYPWYIRTYRLIATLTVLNALLFLIFFYSSSRQYIAASDDCLVGCIHFDHNDKCLAYFQTPILSYKIEYYKRTNYVHTI